MDRLGELLQGRRGTPPGLREHGFLVGRLRITHIFPRNNLFGAGSGVRGSGPISAQTRASHVALGKSFTL